MTGGPRSYIHALQQMQGKPVWRVVGAILGVGLLVGAMVAAAGQIDFKQVADAPWWLLTLLGGGVAANLLLTSLLFWVITRDFDVDPPVSVARMTALISVSALLNYLPLRAGLVGRTTYLKVKHSLPVKQSIITLLIVSVLSAVVLGGTAGAVLVAGQWHQGDSATVVGWVVLVLLLLSPAMGPIARLMLRRPITMAWTWLPLRIADMLVGGGRFWLALWLLGSPLSFDQAMAAGAAGMLVALIGITPNGLGMREWLQAGLSELLAPTSGAIGLTASLLDRAAEAVISTSMGLAAIRWLARQDPANKADPAPGSTTQAEPTKQ